VLGVISIGVFHRDDVAIEVFVNGVDQQASVVFSRNGGAGTETISGDGRRRQIGSPFLGEADLVEGEELVGKSRSPCLANPFGLKMANGNEASVPKAKPKSPLPVFNSVGWRWVGRTSCAPLCIRVRDLGSGFANVARGDGAWGVADGPR